MDFYDRSHLRPSSHAGARHAIGAPANAQIRSAFDAYHQRAGTMPARADSRRAMGSGAWAFVLLALFGFGGSLFLAFFSFNTPEAPVQIASLPPEVMYVAPTASSDALNAGAEHAAADSRSLPPAFAAFSSETVLRDSAGVAIFEGATFPAFDGGDQIARSGTQSIIAGSSTQNTAPAGDASALGPPMAFAYDALNAPAVPEPSTWALIVGGAGMLFAAARKRLPS